jgi:thiamine biosynthesis lipoprotein
MKIITFHAFTLLLLIGCSRGLKSTIKVSGPAQGTSYTISYVAGANANYRTAIDSILLAIDASLSTYQPQSIISRINRNEPTAVDAYFTEVFKKSMEVSEKTDGLFDVTVAPLVNAYGFGFRKKEQITPQKIDRLRKLVGYKNLSLRGNQLTKTSPEVMLDFNAIAQGYTVDVLAAFLDSKGIDHYLVELGGELRARGKKLDGGPWTVGIEQPVEDNGGERALFKNIILQDRSLATSGNYKKFYVENGEKYAHIINPFTGYPAKNNLLSATVVAPDCMTADAYATAFMVMGLDRAKAFLDAHHNLQLSVFFIYDERGNTKTYISPDFPPTAP